MQKKQIEEEEKGEKKLVVMMKKISSIIKTQPEIAINNENITKTDINKEDLKNIGDKDNNDYINVHKMMVELSVFN